MIIGVQSIYNSILNRCSEQQKQDLSQQQKQDLPKPFYDFSSEALAQNRWKIDASLVNIILQIQQSLRGLEERSIQTNLFSLKMDQVDQQLPTNMKFLNGSIDNPVVNNMNHHYYMMTMSIVMIMTKYDLPQCVIYHIMYLLKNFLLAANIVPIVAQSNASSDNCFQNNQIEPFLQKIYEIFGPILNKNITQSTFSLLPASEQTMITKYFYATEISKIAGIQSVLVPETITKVLEVICLNYDKIVKALSNISEMIAKCKSNKQFYLQYIGNMVQVFTDLFTVLYPYEPNIDKKDFASITNIINTQTKILHLSQQQIDQNNLKLKEINQSHEQQLTEQAQKYETQNNQLVQKTEELEGQLKLLPELQLWGQEFLPQATLILQFFADNNIALDVSKSCNEIMIKIGKTKTDKPFYWQQIIKLSGIILKSLKSTLKNELLLNQKQTEIIEKNKTQIAQLEKENKTLSYAKQNNDNASKKKEIEFDTKINQLKDLQVMENEAIKKQMADLMTENQKLLGLLKDKNIQIESLEATFKQVTKDLKKYQLDNEQLRNQKIITQKSPEVNKIIEQVTNLFGVNPLTQDNQWNMALMNYKQLQNKIDQLLSEKTTLEQSLLQNTDMINNLQKTNQAQNNQLQNEIENNLKNQQAQTLFQQVLAQNTKFQSTIQTLQSEKEQLIEEIKEVKNKFNEGASWKKCNDTKNALDQESWKNQQLIQQQEENDKEITMLKELLQKQQQIINEQKEQIERSELNEDSVNQSQMSVNPYGAQMHFGQDDNRSIISDIPQQQPTDNEDNTSMISDLQDPQHTTQQQYQKQPQQKYQQQPQQKYQQQQYKQYQPNRGRNYNQSSRSNYQQSDDNYGDYNQNKGSNYQQDDDNYGNYNQSRSNYRGNRGNNSSYKNQGYGKRIFIKKDDN